MKILRVSGGDAKRLCDELDAVAVSLDTARSIEEIELAHHLAKDSFGNGTNIAKKLKYEFLLWLSGTRDIKNAFKKTAPREGKDSIIIISVWS